MACAAYRWLNIPVDPKPRPNVARWLDRLAERPASACVLGQPLS